MSNLVQFTTNLYHISHIGCFVSPVCQVVVYCALEGVLPDYVVDHSEYYPSSTVRDLIE